jgi:hypothetical protein
VIRTLPGQQAFSEVEPLVRFFELAAQRFHLVLQCSKPGRVLRIPEYAAGLESLSWSP